MTAELPPDRLSRPASNGATPNDSYKETPAMDSLTAPSAPPPATTLTSILAALGDEFQELGRFAEQLQTVLSPALLRIANDPDCHRNVQMLDLLSQRLHALSAFVCSVGGTVPGDWEIDSSFALSAVTLSDLAWRLQGVQSAEEHHQAGALEMF
jgi:hypothetical protein